jgi:hypothetical protein
MISYIFFLNDLGAANSYGSYLTEFVPEAKNTKKTPVRPNSSVN